MNATATITSESGNLVFPDGTTESGVVISVRLQSAGITAEVHACEGRFLMVRRHRIGRIEKTAEISSEVYDEIAGRAARLIEAQQAAEKGLALLVARALY